MLCSHLTSAFASMSPSNLTLHQCWWKHKCRHRDWLWTHSLRQRFHCYWHNVKLWRWCKHKRQVWTGLNYETHTPSGLIFATFKHFVTARNEVAARLCFHRCLWFCSQGGGWQGDVRGRGVCLAGSVRGRNGRCSGRYTSYWNAFLFHKASVISMF